MGAFEAEALAVAIGVLELADARRAAVADDSAITGANGSIVGGFAAAGFSEDTADSGSGGGVGGSGDGGSSLGKSGRSDKGELSARHQYFEVMAKEGENAPASLSPASPLSSASSSPVS